MISQYRKAAGEYRELQEYVDDGPEKKNEDTEEAEETTVDFDALKEINPDIVAWIRIPEVLDYPVVQGEDNSYYLFHTFRGENNIAGSIFLDYRNSSDFTDGRSIIYGHNMYYSGVMFGTLHRVLNSSWYNNEENLNIQFDTMYESMTWRIYSIYTIPKTSDYLKVTFKTNEEKQ